MKRPTQADVARLAGVSRATVSYVLSGHGTGSISVTEETRQRVLGAVERLGYQPDAAAQSLRLGKTHTIGLLIPDMRNPHYWQIARGVEEEAQVEGYDLLLTSTALDPVREAKSVRALLRGRIDGLVLDLTFCERLLEEEGSMLVRSRSPVALLGAGIKGLDVVEPGYTAGAIEMMRYLLSLGHRRLALVYGVAHAGLGADRLNAFHEVLGGAGLPHDEAQIERCGSLIEDGYQATLRLLDRTPRPTAVLVINDLLAIGVLRAITDRGLRVPDDLSVVGFDDIEMSAYLNPSLTTVRVNTEEVGRRGVRLVFDRMDDPERPPQHVRVPAELVVRASTGAPPVEMEGGGRLRKQLPVDV